MPIAGKSYLQKFNLPGYPEDDPAWVEIETKPKSSVRDGINEALTSSEVVNLMYSRIILDWNFTDEAGAKLSITPDNVEKSLSLLDKDFIATKIGIAGLPEAKKNS